MMNEQKIEKLIMKKRAILFAFCILFLLFPFSLVFAQEYYCSVDLGKEYVKEVKQLDATGLQQAFGDNWADNVLFKGLEVGQRQKTVVTSKIEKPLNGKEGWSIIYNEWNPTSGEFSEQPDVKDQEAWMPKNPKDLGTMNYWTKVWVPTPIKEYLLEVQWGTGLVPEDQTVFWTIDKDSAFGTALGLKQTVQFAYSYIGGIGMYAGISIENSEGKVLFEIDHVESIISGYPLIYFALFFALSLLGTILLLKNKFHYS